MCKLFLYFYRNSDTENNSNLFKTYAVDLRRLLSFSVTLHNSLKMSTVKNPTFTFDLTQMQVVSFQCNQFFIKNHKDIKYRLKIILKYVGFC